MNDALQAALPRSLAGARVWTISLPLSWHARHGRTATGKTYTKAEAERSEQNMMKELLEQGWREPKPGRWTVMARFYIPRETQDGDNLFKSLADFLKRSGALGVDDRYFRSGGFEVLLSKTNPRCEFICVPYVGS